MKKTVGILVMWSLVSHASAVFGEMLDGVRDSIPWPEDKEEYRPPSDENPQNMQNMEDNKSGNKVLNNYWNTEPREKHSAGVIPITIKGVVLAVVPNAESITVGDSLTGDQRIFRANKNLLLGLTPGQKVNVTPQNDDPHMVRRIESDPNALY